MTVIESIGTATPAFRHSQKALCSFLEENLPMEESSRMLMHRISKSTSIEARYSVIPDFSLPEKDWQFIRKSGGRFSLGGLEQRMELFFSEVLPLSLQAVSNLDTDGGFSDVTHLIAVTCTGLAAPGLDLMLMEALGLRSDTARSAIHFMGCYAAIHALRQADYICRANPEARVLMVCAELCTLHIQADARPDNLASTLLFGDGAAAVLLCHADAARSKPLFGLKSFASVVLPAEKKQMAWNLSAEGFRMDLGIFVPELIGNGIEALLEGAAAGSGTPVQGWAIHPGGRKILDKVAEGLKIHADNLASGYEVLRNYGNMSSPTVLFVMKEEHRKMSIENRKGPVFSAAFGPGLSMESLILDYVD
jgi:predicted naringenin-chalcone synthase